jgi:phytoene desaturase
MKKVVIIGAGIAGLTCAVYARLNGFETELYEMHTIPGGECTGWDRGDYHFDGCIHWLMGTKEGIGLNRIWRDTGALDDTVKIVNHEIFSRYEQDGQAVNFYTDVDRLEKHLIEVSPQDKGEIGKLCNAIRILAGMEMPVDKPMDMMTAKDGIGYALSNLRKISKMSQYGKMTVADLAERFKQPLLKRALLSVIPGNNPAYALVMTLSSMNDGDSGYPLGGSRALARRMEKRFTDLGGKITCKAKVDKILEDNRKAVGIRLADGTQIMGDYIVSCADGYATLYHMLEDKYTPEMYRNLFDNPVKYPTPTCAIVFMGVNAELKDCRAVMVRRKEPVTLTGIREEYINLLNYSFDNTMAPQGKTVVACYYGADYDYWHALDADKEKYAAGKKRLAEDAAAQVIARHPEAEGRIEVIDVVTPVTYERYCNAWRGSWMTWSGGGKDVPRYYPGVLPGLTNFIMAGMWTQPPGGLPGAGMAGRSAVYRLCIWEGKEFKTK